MSEMPIAIERVLISENEEEESKNPMSSDAIAIVTEDEVKEMRVENGKFQFHDYCVRKTVNENNRKTALPETQPKQLEPISCAALLHDGRGPKIASGVTGHGDGNVCYWSRPDKPPASLINYDCSIVSVKPLGKYVIIATSFKKLFMVPPTI